MCPLVWHNRELEQLWEADEPLLARVEAIARVFEQHATLQLRPLPSGLYPAVSVDASNRSSGYGNVWVRDNAFVAYAHYRSADPESAARVLRALFEFFFRHRSRFEAIIAGEADPRDAMQRPHVRFDGATLEELDEPWSHAQNDALGYAMWLYIELVVAGAVEVDAQAQSVLELFPEYWNAIRYWQDEDSGHWEEQRKQSASSIGVVVAALEAFVDAAVGGRIQLAASVVELASEISARGRHALGGILPSECVQSEPSKRRRYDAALLFLVHPLGVVRGEEAVSILDGIGRHLAGEIGVRRYLGDSYWAPDYDERLPEMERTKDFSKRIELRNRLLEHEGQEAQWCIFDSMLSDYFGSRHRTSGAESDLDLQVHHFARSIAQITPEARCPELYFLKHGRYAHNPHVPLLWAQANLRLALDSLRENLAARDL